MIKAEAILELISTAILVFDGDLNLRSMNIRAENLLSVSAAQRIGGALTDLFPGDGLYEAVTRAQREGQAITERDMTLRIADRPALLVDCSATPFAHGTEGKPAVVVELIDVSHHQRMQLEENMTTQSQITHYLLRGLAHEVKNPLGGIRGAAQLLERALPEARYKEYTEIIISETDRLRAVVDRMLGPSEAVKRVPLNVHTVLERVRNIVEAEAAGGVAVIRDYDPSLPELGGDPDLLVQAFLNILRNAVQAVNLSGGAVTIRTRAQRKFTIGTKIHRLVIRVDIVDTGPGVAPEIASSIFFPMVSGRAEGSGLGLPIASTLIHRHGGLIGFVSQPGDTVFTVWLPVESLT
jgi:two-component system nitrogen regulation sensor histidine kinase GlnL